MTIIVYIMYMKENIKLQSGDQVQKNAMTLFQKFGKLVYIFMF